MKNSIREPRQERAIEKKNRIIEAGYKLFSEVGYYGTNTAEIAKEAGVSTGIVYGYFQDKRDILICVLNIYMEKVVEPLLKIFNTLKSRENLAEFIPKIIDNTIKMHKKHTKIHEALHSLASTDEVVNAEFIAMEDSITEKIYEQLKRIDLQISNPIEKIHFAMDIVQSFAHEYVFDKHEYIDYIAMRDLVCESVINLFRD